MVLHHECFHIRIPADRSLFAAPRGFSQLIASFFGFRCQGIHPVLFLAWTSSNNPWFSMIFYITLDLLEFVFAWVSQIGLFVLSYILRSIVSLFTLVWKDLFLSLKNLSFCLSLNHTFAWFWFAFLLFSCQRPLSTIKYPSMHLNPFKYIHQYLICGGPEWARTTDLALIRRTL